MRWKVKVEQILKSEKKTIDYTFEDWVRFTFEDGIDEPIHIIKKINDWHLDIYEGKGMHFDFWVSCNIE